MKTVLSLSDAVPKIITLIIIIVNKLTLSILLSPFHR